GKQARARGGVRARGENQGPGLGDRSKGPGDADRVARPCFARLEREPCRLPLQMGGQRPHAPCERQAALAEVARHRRRDGALRADLRGRALHRLGAGAKAREEIGLDLRKGAARVSAHVGLDRLALGLRRPARTAALRLADALEDSVPGAQSSAFTMSSTTFFASPNTIMVLSM